MEKHDPRVSARSSFIKGKSALLMAGLFLGASTQAQYCDVVFDSPEPICNVTFSNINNSSDGSTDAPGYEDFTDITGMAIRGNTYALTVTGNTDGPYENTVWAYFDWDGNGEFTAPDEVFLVGILDFTNCEAAGAVSTDIPIPLDAIAGITRMRIIKQFGTDVPSPNDGCTLAGLGFGQVEDYTLELIEGIPCSAIPSPGNTTGPAQICSGSPFTVAVENQTFEQYITYQWQTSTDGVTWVDAPGNSTDTHFTTSQMENTWYRAQVTCAEIGTGTSEPLEVTMVPGSECYCTTIDFVLEVEPICNVTFANIDNSSPGVGDNLPSLEDFTDLTAELTRGFDYLLSVKGNTTGSYTNYVTAFFDWNGDGEFETVIPIDSLYDDNCEEAISVMISVPLDAASASRMRIVKNYNETPEDPCGVYNFGQAEDYSVEVTSTVGIANVSTADFGVYPNPASTELFIASANGLPVHVKVYDMVGHFVMERNTATRLDIADLAPGSYNLLIMNDQGTSQAHARFVKQ